MPFRVKTAVYCMNYREETIRCLGKIQFLTLTQMVIVLPAA